MGILDLVRKVFETRSIEDIVREERCSCERKELSYLVAINDKSIANPFVLSKEIVAIASGFREISGEKERAKSLFDWVIENVEYRKGGRYKNAVEVLAMREGLCAEEAVLYITMARCCGLKAQYASVEKDDDGKKVKHACAAVEIDGKNILVDPAYYKFGIMHRKYSIITDEEVRKRYELWNR